MTVWTNYPPLIQTPSILTEKIPQNRVIIGSPSGDDASLEEADVAFGQPGVQRVIALTSLQWIHVNTAGYTKYDRDDLRVALQARGGILTNSSSVYAEPCAQHALAMMLALARKLPQSLHNQQHKAWPSNKVRSSSPLLNGQKVLLIGYGSIARRLTELLAPLRMNVIGFRRTIRGDETVPMCPLVELNSHVAGADHVVNLLPSSPATTQFFDADRFRLMKPSAVFYNIGRGDTVDQVALRTTLETRSIASAYIDVTSPEPLPPDDPLWTTPNCYITPHSAGGHVNEVERVVEHFTANLSLFESRMALLDRIF